jgi:molybdate transport system substrate-binding protein
MLRILCLLLILCGHTVQTAHGAEVRVAVAANFAAPLAALAEGFQRSTGHTLKVSAGATGKFYSQIKAGAPFDVLLAADASTPSRLVQEGLAVAGSQFNYANGRLVLWSATPGLVDAAGAVLSRGAFKHLAIANPKTAPYGQAAVQVMQALGLVAALKPKWVVGESVAQAYQFVVTGNAELGFVALSQTQLQTQTQTPLQVQTQSPSGASAQPPAGSRWLVPASLHSPIQQDAVMLLAGATNPAASALMAYLKGDAAKPVLLSFGYLP